MRKEVKGKNKEGVETTIYVKTPSNVQNTIAAIATTATSAATAPLML
jgi:hypothetical protein